MSPRYLANQIERSRRNFALETIDVFYLHNPESQLASVARPLFEKRLRDAFTALESAVRDGRIRFYGTATWNGFRVAPARPDHLSLERLVALAREAGGEHHHLRFVQLPFNLGMPEAHGLHNQARNGALTPLLDAAQQLGVAVIGSATLHQGQLTQGLPDFIAERLGMPSDAGNAIQFARSAPGLLTALIGMSDERHVAANLEVARHTPTALDTWQGLFTKS